MNIRYVLISAAIAGTISALLSALPLVNLVNCLLCGWLWLAGIAAVWMYRFNTGQSVDNRGGTILGAVSGLFGAAVATILSAITGAGATSQIPAEQMAQLDEVFGDAAAVITSPATALVMTVVIYLIIYPLFGILGGLIGTSIMRRKAI